MGTHFRKKFSRTNMSKQGSRDKDNDSEASVFRIHPYHYIHVLDQTSNVTRVEIGPQTFIRKDNEKVLLAPTKMVIVPPGCYCSVTNPAKKDKSGEPVKDTLNQVVLQFGELEVRLEQDPFPLYPGEVLTQAITSLPVVPVLSALKLKVLRDFTNEDTKEERRVGEEFLFEGPGVTFPEKRSRWVKCSMPLSS